MDKNFKKDKNY